MNRLDQMVEQLAFGRERAKPAVSLGLYLSPDVVYISETRLDGGGRLVVDHLIRIPIPSDAKKTGATATMSADFLSEPTKITEALRSAMSQVRWSSKSVRVTLSHHLGLLRYFPIPAIDHRFLKSAVPLEAKKRIPLPFETLAYDFQTVPLPPDAAGKPRQGVLVAVTQQKNIASVLGLLGALDLKLTGLEVAPLSVLRLWQELEPPRGAHTILHVHIDGGSVRVMAVDRGVPALFREVFLPEDVAPADLRKIDMKGFLSFLQKQLGLAGPATLRVSGNSANLAVLKDAFAQETGLPAAIQDTPKLLSIKAGDWGGYAALGASMRSLAPDAAAIDLSATDRISDEERSTARDILIAGAAAALFFAAGGALKSAAYSYRAKELRQYERMVDADIKRSLAGLDSVAIETMLRDMQTQLDQLKGAGGRRPKISATLREIIAEMPETLWLERLLIADALIEPDKHPRQILLYGRVRDRAVADEQALAFRFKDALSKGRIGKEFDVSFSLQESVGTEEGTQFTLELRAKR